MPLLHIIIGKGALIERDRDLLLITRLQKDLLKPFELLWCAEAVLHRGGNIELRRLRPCNSARIFHSEGNNQRISLAQLLPAKF